MSWTDERVELLRKLWLDGLSASRIAAELAEGVTRNAVIGKVHRLGLSGREKAVTSADPLSRARSKVPQSSEHVPVELPDTSPMPIISGNNALAIQARPMAIPQVQRSSGDVVIPMTEHVTIMDLRDTMCRWPMGDPTSTDFRYCGGKSTAGEGPYCNMHSRMAYQPMQDRRRERRIA